MNIQALLESGANVAVTVTPLDLKEFALFLIGEAQAIGNENSQTEKFLTPDEVSNLLGVSKNTLWRWEKDHYLTPVKIGRKSRYKQSDVLALMNGKEEQK
jgi:excisionase family DNA binding protein